MCSLPKKTSTMKKRRVVKAVCLLPKKSDSAGIIPSPQCIWFLKAYRIHCPKTSNGNLWKPMVFTFLSFLGLRPIFRCYCWLSPWNIVSRENKDYILLFSFVILWILGFALSTEAKGRRRRSSDVFQWATSMVRNGKRQGAAGRQHRRWQGRQHDSHWGHSDRQKSASSLMLNTKEGRQIELRHSCYFPCCRQQTRRLQAGVDLWPHTDER